MGRPKYEPTNEERNLVKLAAALGIPQPKIAEQLGVTDRTLRRKFKKEWTAGATEANLRVGKSLFDKCMAGDTTAMIWWTKTRMGWNTGETVNKNMIFLGGGGDDQGPDELRQSLRDRIDSVAGRAIEGELLKKSE